MAKSKSRPKVKRLYLQEWMDELHVVQELLSARSGVAIGTISGWWSTPTIKPQPTKFLAVYGALKELDREDKLGGSGDLFKPPHVVLAEREAPQRPTDEELLANKDKLFEGLEMLAAKNGVTEIEILRKFAEWRDKGIIK